MGRGEKKHKMTKRKKGSVDLSFQVAFLFLVLNLPELILIEMHSSN